MKKLLPISALEDCGIPLRTMREWCERGQVDAEKIKGEWYIDLDAMLRRNDLDVLADKLAIRSRD